MKETNLKAVKDMAKTLLYCDILETEFDTFLIHPFMNQRFFCPGLNTDNKINMIDILESEENLNIARNKYSEMINDAKNIYHILMLMHKPFRPLLFKLCYKDLSEEDYAEVLKEIWTGTENPNQDANVSIKQWIRFFKKADKKLIMNKEEYNFYNKLPDEEPITIYRGVGKGREPYGLSWTNNLETAKWFANRWQNTEAYMFKTQCYKKDIFAYFNSRGEDELVTNVNVLDKNNIERIDLNGRND